LMCEACHELQNGHPEHRLIPHGITAAQPHLFSDVSAEGCVASFCLSTQQS
jgi:hypothetical protein